MAVGKLGVIYLLYELLYTLDNMLVKLKEKEKERKNTNIFSYFNSHISEENAVVTEDKKNVASQQEENLRQRGKKDSLKIGPLVEQKAFIKHNFVELNMQQWQDWLNA